MGERAAHLVTGKMIDFSEFEDGFAIVKTRAPGRTHGKTLAHPVSVDSLPPSANQEDHVSMATFAARRLQPMIANSAHILGIELLAAAQSIKFLRPLETSAALEQVHALVRSRCPPTDGSHPRSNAPRRSCATARCRTCSARCGGCRRCGSRRELRRFNLLGIASRFSGFETALRVRSPGREHESQGAAG